MEKILGAIIFAAFVIVGIQLAGAIHECGHAATAIVLGGHVQSIRPFKTAAGPAATRVDGLDSDRLAVVAGAGVLFAGLAGMAAALVAPWGRLRNVWGVALAGTLLPFAFNPVGIPLGKSPDGTALAAVLPLWVVATVAGVWCVVCVYVWFSRMRTVLVGFFGMDPYSGCGRTVQRDGSPPL